MRRTTLWRLALGLTAAALAAVLLSAEPARPAEPAKKAEEKLVGRVKTAIDKGVQFLRESQLGDGSWDLDPESKMDHGEMGSFRGGWTALALLALLNSGVSPDDAVVKKGLEHLRAIEPAQTYVVGLQTMVFCQAGKAVDRERIQRNVEWLEKARLDGGKDKDGKPYPSGWTYKAIRGLPDNSCTQYALLGLHEALLAGAKVDRAGLKAMRDYYLATQKKDGGWLYREDERGGVPTLTMTTSGLCNLIITGEDLETGKAVLDEDSGVATDCGKYDENGPVLKAVDYLSDHLPDPLTDRVAEAWGTPFYALYGIERAGRLTGRRYLGNRDWYRIGCQYLVDAQKNNGSWGQRDLKRLDGWPVIATSFSLLFLSKGRTPVLVTKMAHGGGEGWNNKHNDARHLVEFASRELFRKRPMAWQSFDVRSRKANDVDSRRALAAELLQSPVCYINGHEFSPSGKEKDILKEYLDNGGFLFAEACCGSKDFDSGFKDFIKEVFPDDALEELPAEHPVYTASGKFFTSPKDFPLYGVQKGCKTVVIYSPKPVAGYWEGNLFEKGRGQKAFQLGANVIAYATGLEPPKDKLTEVAIVADDKPGDKGKRGFLKVAQLRHEGDWQPAPKAMRNLMAEVRKDGLDVELPTRPVSPASDAVKDYFFLYMHGRNDFKFDAKDLKNLRFRLENGGMLLADSCCGAKAFDEAFHKFIETLFADKKLKLEPISLGDELYGAALNGQAIEKVKARRELPGGKRDLEYREGAPLLEGVRLNGRWVVIYSRYDLGCALERHAASDCLGHDYESAVRLGRAAVLYALKR
jgi:hypothetical protein